MAKDHYIPNFCLKRWVKGGRTLLFLAYIGKGFRGIDWQPKTPKSIGCQESLYQEQVVEN